MFLGALAIEQFFKWRYPKVTDAERWAEAIFTIESGGVANAMGDRGRALGPGQMHPAFFHEYAPAPHLGETWADWFRAAAIAFYEREVKVTADPVVLAMRYHLGHFAARSDSEWDNSYAARFRAAFDRLASAD